MIERLKILLTLMILSQSVSGCARHLRGEVTPIRPAALKHGDTIAFVAPAGRLDQTRMELARDRLEAMGFNVRVPDDLYRTRGYLAGTDERRAAELMAAFRDPEVAAVFPGTGNYGCTRMIDLLDYDVIRKNPKIFVGFSDLTALHLAIQRKTGLVTFHSPNPMYGLGSPDNLSQFSAEYFWRALLDESYNNENAEGYRYKIPSDVATLRSLSGGVARGQLTGGNLSLIIALMGTEFEMETSGRILFLEDVSERPYRIDRYLSQLRLAGKLNEVAGVILGRFSKCEARPGDDSLSLDEVFTDYFANLGVPVIADFPAGHSGHNATLPFGEWVEIDADQLTVTLLHDPVTSD